MKLKTRIIISFFTIILVPLVFTSIAFVGFMRIQLASIRQEYNIQDATYESLSNNISLLNKMTRAVYNEIEQTARENPELLLSQSYLGQISVQLKNNYSYLIVREGEELRYNGVPEAVGLDQSLLPEYGDSGAGSNSGLYISDNSTHVLIKQIDFEFSDGELGSAFIVTKADAVVPQMKSMVTDMLFIIVLILILTSFGLSFWIYRGVVTPLNHLKKATQNIKEGNLDFTVEASGVEEVNELCEDFEEMRRRLKETADEKMVFERESKELISNISHDLKTPITAVKGYVEGIMDGVADTPEKMQKYIRTIYNKANEMDRLINELTFYSKIDTNRIPYTFSKIHITEYFEDCVEELSTELDAKNVDFTYSNYVEEDVVVIADAEQLKRVINNIISNSLKYMNKPKGKIAMRIRDVGDFIQVEIEDNGKGIANKDLANIFERFYRTDASRNSSKGGSGIGLSIVKKIMEDHGGKVWATSKLDVGTTMYFVLRKYQEVPINE